MTTYERRILVVRIGRWTSEKPTSNNLSAQTNDRVRGITKAGRPKVSKTIKWGAFGHDEDMRRNRIMS
eukprot:4841100-Amphidinium_carterae.1